MGLVRLNYLLIETMPFLPIPKSYYGFEHRDRVYINKKG